MIFFISWVLDLIGTENISTIVFSCTVYLKMLTRDTDVKPCKRALYLSEHIFFSYILIYNLFIYDLRKGGFSRSPTIQYINILKHVHKTCVFLIAVGIVAHCLMIQTAYVIYA